jgi:hypothetical protein
MGAIARRKVDFLHNHAARKSRVRRLALTILACSCGSGKAVGPSLERN